MGNNASILIFIDWFLPAYKAGGPIKSVYNIINSISDDVNIKVVTSDKDVDGTVLDVPKNIWVDKGSYKVFYMSKTLSMYKFLKDEDLKLDTIYLNSVFSFKFSVLPLLFFRTSKIKKVLAPRGMLGEGALQIKPFKKKVFLTVAKVFLFNDIVWHASTENEQKEVLLKFGKNAKCQVAQNISSSPQRRDSATNSKEKNELKLVFISRLSTKKNLMFILIFFKKLSNLDGLILDIYGPIEDEDYWKDCLSIINSDDRINYSGLLEPNEVHNTLIKYHFSVLPTLHENYGHSIVESINAGVPVLISSNTPWRDLTKFNVGYDLELKNQDMWKETLLSIYKMGNEEYCKMVDACFEYSNQKIVNPEIINQNKKLFT